MPFEFPYRAESLVLNEAARQAAPGQFMDLSAGRMHYELAGPETGQLVVLVHGFSVPFFIWDGTFEALAAAGLRVLRFDLFGRGFSDRPFARYDLEFFVRQLDELLQALAPSQPVALCGLSMGGVIVSRFAGTNPDRVKRIALIDPAGFPLGYSWAYRLAKVPGLGELGLSLLSAPNLENSIAGDFFDPRLVKRFIERYRPQMKYKGFRRAILSTLRNGILDDGMPEYRRIGETEMPALLVWGREDQTVPFRYHREVLAAIPQVEFVPVDEAGHLPHIEQAATVNPVLANFFLRQGPN